MDGKKEDIMKKGVSVPIEWHIPEDMTTPLALNMVVQLIEDIFKVSFFDTKYPLRLDESAPPPSKIRANCIASVFITPGKMPKFIEALQSNYDRYLSATQKDEKIL